MILNILRFWFCFSICTLCSRVPYGTGPGCLRFFWGGKSVARQQRVGQTHTEIFTLYRYGNDKIELIVAEYLNQNFKNISTAPK